MESILQLKKGEIHLNEEEVVILDNAKKLRIMSLVNSVLFIIMSVLFYLKELKGESYMVWLWGVIGLAHIGILVNKIFFMTTDSVLFLNEINAVKRHPIRDEILYVFTKGSRKKRCINAEPSMIENLKNYFKEKGISVK
ncbi:hypothetical protein V6R21_13835 [Limibacter armeniacum]|uniref:hypothetical protein n=1 Tax=Limibacter armeniacum TaxID=466084 RepID=UPI002FE64AE7